MTIRRLSTDQLPLILPLLAQVQSLHVDAQPHRYSDHGNDEERVAWLTGWLTKDRVHFLVTGPVHAPTAYLAFATFDEPASTLGPAQRYAVLEHICVGARHRREGLARELIAAMREHLKADGINYVRVKYAEWNKASAALMASEGFGVTHIEAEARLAPSPV